MNVRSLSTEELAERWGRRPEWVTYAARTGAIPGAWKLGHYWRFFLPEVEAFETSQQSTSIFALAPGAAARRRK
ncbi:hypothetical protein [Arthrobacter luteolus]|uniref:hypothetical protein n=1 Tax=Arthrobacter luteolus TaxID=98672 RepID=UPI000AC38D8B|nr:hypothetical protein [Arthrobacter luteolus]